jgi:hypothetical protein
MYEQASQEKMVDRRASACGPERGVCRETLVKNNSVIGALEHGIEDLSENLLKSVQELNASLSAILLPESETLVDDKKNPSPPVSLCQLTTMVYEYNRKVQRALCIIRGMINRCEL